jgi:hypothetical protein
MDERCNVILHRMHYSRRLKFLVFFHHKDLGNHLLQLCPKVVKHSVCTGSSTADFVYLTFPELLDSMACIFSEILTSEYFFRTAMRERRSVEEFSVDTTARHVNCYICPLNLLNQYFTGSRFFHHNRFCVLLSLWLCIVHCHMW